MSRTAGKPVRILYQEVRTATIRKARTESAEAATGGGARDLRLSPYPQLRPFMERMLTRTEVRGVGTTVRLGTATWGDGTHTREIAFWPPTNARPGEGRIATISALPPLMDPPQELNGAVFLFVQDDNDLIWVRYASSDQLDGSLPEIGDVIRECLRRNAGKRIATGYIEFTPDGLKTWCNARQGDN